MAWSEPKECIKSNDGLVIYHKHGCNGTAERGCDLVKTCPGCGLPENLQEHLVDCPVLAARMAGEQTGNEPDGGFREWAERWIAATMPEIQRKAEEYGSNSLQAQGALLATLRGWPDGHVKVTAELLELGCFDYAHGKMNRVKDAVLRDKLPSVDTWHDIAVYALMAMYIRERGNWP